MSWLKKLTSAFKSQPVDPAHARWLEGYNAYEKGMKHYSAEPPEAEEALGCFDKAIECGMDDVDVRFTRGLTLQAMGYHFDAMDDLNKAVELDPEDSNKFFVRSLSRSSLEDFHGSLADLEEAVRLAAFDTPLNRSYDEDAREMGHANGVIGLYKRYIFSVKISMEPRLLPRPKKEPKRRPGYSTTS